MPYKSERQRRFMHAKKPEIAARWDREYGGKIVTGTEGVSRKSAPTSMTGAMKKDGGVKAGKLRRKRAR